MRVNLEHPFHFKLPVYPFCQAAVVLFPLCGLFLAQLPASAVPAPRLAGGRVERLFDEGWRFHRGDEPQAWRPDYDDRGWRRVDLPHDWSIEDLPAAQPGATTVSLVPGEWRFKPGDDPAWKAPAFDDSGWQTVTLPGSWKAVSNLTATNAYGWYRRRFQAPTGQRGRDLTLLLGKIDDVDETYVNGVKIGGMGSFPPSYSSAWEEPRRYTVPAAILKGDGTDVVAVRDYNGEGDAGIYEAVAAPRRSGPFDTESVGGVAQGYTVGGIGWYRKRFTLPRSESGKQVWLRFDGVYMNSRIWLNGQSVGAHPYGYTSFILDLTPSVRFGNEVNLLAVRVDASGRTSRWYSGSGIYRHVWLTTASPSHIDPWGVAVTTTEADAARAQVHVRTAVTSDGGRATTLESTIVDGEGRVIASAQEPVAGVRSIDQPLTVAKPHLWSPDSPTLYTLVSRLKVGDRTVDAVSTTFGIRTIRLDATHGFLLNGEPIKLRGGDVHHDNGCLGSRAYDAAEARRVALLKASGFNAIRTSHNPPSPAFLDACDQLGVLVMDEAFDCWRYGKNPDDYGRFFDEWWQRDLDSMVLRDRNHPSIALWSIGNEIPGQDTPEGAAVGARLAGRVRELDSTRPVTQAAYPDDTAKLAPLFSHLDAAGYNYMAGQYEADHQKHPDRVMVGTESFPTGCFDQWMAVIDHPYVIGDFVWTAFDYLGEAGLGKTVPQSVPAGYVDDRLWTVSNCGDFDLCRFKRPPSYYRDAVWGLKPTVAAFVEDVGPDGQPERVEGWGWPDEWPSWTWPRGRLVTVRVYSDLPRVRLQLNGRDLGVQETSRQTRFTATWKVPYKPGELAAIGLDASNREAARWVLKTAGAPAAIRVSVDRRALKADGEDLAFATVEIVDGQGIVEPNASDLVQFTLRGAGTIAGVGNGDPRSMESFQQPRRHVYHGRCLVVVRAGKRRGEIRLQASAPGLRSAEVTLSAVRP